MRLYIKGMEMPKDGCKDCLLVKRGRVFDICPFLKREVNGNVERGGKPYDCPLSPDPPHGDLIERKAVYLTDFEIAMCNGDYKEGMKMLLEKIESAPTIIPAEEDE